MQKYEHETIYTNRLLLVIIYREMLWPIVYEMVLISFGARKIISYWKELLKARWMTRHYVCKTFTMVNVQGPGIWSRVRRLWPTKPTLTKTYFCCFHIVEGNLECRESRESLTIVWDLQDPSLSKCWWESYSTGNDIVPDVEDTQ